MGTSQGSGGPGPNVPMVPPWVPPLPPDDPLLPDENLSDEPVPEDGGDETQAPSDVNPIQQAPAPPPLSPPARFRMARQHLGEFTASGDQQELRRAIGNYVRTGYGGTNTAARRLGGTVRTAGVLNRILSGGSGGDGTAAEAGESLDRAILDGRSADEVMGAVTEAVRPVDGSLDAEGSRAAIQEALSDTLTQFDEADLLNLTPEQREFTVERFTALDVFRRIELDIGKTIIEKATSATAALSRLKQMRDYVKETVAASFRVLKRAGTTVTGRRIEGLVRGAISETLKVFEGWLE